MQEKEMITSSAAELYREMKQRSLHLRKNNGRDNELIYKLCNRLGCEDGQLQKHLDKSNMPAMEFFKIFMELTEPFVLMYQDIWSYMSRNRATYADENIKIRFGCEDDVSELDLDDFVRSMKLIEKCYDIVSIKYWSHEMFHKLFNLGSILNGEISFRDRMREQANKSTIYYRYHPGKSFDLPEVIYGKHEFDKILKEIRDLFQSIIDDYVLEANESNKQNELKVWLDDEKSNHTNVLRNYAYLLTDLLPRWYYYFTYHEHIEESIKDKALVFYQKEILPNLTGMQKKVTVKQLLNVLELPFWKHRWHTYEIWVTLLTLNSMSDYKPIPRVKDGFIPFEATNAEIVADVKTNKYEKANIAVQVQTNFVRERRKAIKPDLRICYDEEFVEDNTAIVIEYKQRKRLTPKEYIEMATSYRDGGSRCVGVIVVNYDKFDLGIEQPEDCYYIQELNPLSKKALSAFKDVLYELLKKADMKPAKRDTMVLLDVSGSMRNLYDNISVKRALKSLINSPWVNVLRFNSGLIDSPDGYNDPVTYLSTYGSTSLRKSLEEIKEKVGLPKKLLVVTDGGHDHPKELIDRIEAYNECLPNDIEDYLYWLLN